MKVKGLKKSQVEIFDFIRLKLINKDWVFIEL